MRIIVAEDYRAIRDTHIELLRELCPDADIVACADGEEAWEAYQLQTPDLVVTDFQMPRKSGGDLAGLINKSGHGTPILLVSGIANLTKNDHFTLVCSKGCLQELRDSLKAIVDLAKTA